MSAFEVLVSGLAFPEGPRWHQGALYFSDVHSHQVLRWGDGAVEILAHVPEKPSGLGFIGDTTLLIASQHDRRVYSVDLAARASEPQLHADVAGVATWHLNDMLTDATGRAYVGNYGNGAPPGEPIQPASLALVELDGSVRSVAEDLYFPNGMAIVDNGRTLVVAETRSEPGRLTAFSIADDGSLSDRRVVIEFDGQWPDGISVDKHGNIWVALPFDDEVVCVSMHGEILDRVFVPQPYAVAVGGDEGRDLFVASAKTWIPAQAAVEREGMILRVSGAVPA